MTNKRNSIIDMLNEGSSEELNHLKEFLDILKIDFDIKLDETERLAKRRQTNQKLDYVYINSNVKQIIDNCLERTNSNGLANKKSDLSLKILESLASNSLEIDAFDKCTNYVTTLLDKVFFEKLTKMFQTTSPDFSLKLVKSLIEFLGKSLHHNLSIINPLLQIMEMAFKHSNNEIKAQCYECWSSLIKNFALDKDFFFKPKKFSLILMPLLNKCKTYKDENVCKSKVLAWLCLIENINANISKYLFKVLIPFFNYCFGLGSQLIETMYPDEGEDQKQNELKFKKFLSTKIQSEHDFQSLKQIATELFCSLLFNSDTNSASFECKKKFIYIKSIHVYDIHKSFDDKNFWFCLFKFYFELILSNKSNQIGDGLLLIETWKQLCKFLNLDYKSDEEVSLEEEQMICDKQTEDYELPKETMKNFIDFFLLNSVDFANNFITSTKNIENKFISGFIKLLTITIKNEYEKHLIDKEDLKPNIIKLVKKSANLLLTSDEESSNQFMNNLLLLFQIMEKNLKLIDLYQWVHLLTKFYDHLKSIKTKTNQINLSERNYELVNQCIMFPFKYFKLLSILDTDIKLIINTCTNIVKLFTGLIKQNRIKINFDFETDSQLVLESQNVNNWCSKLFLNLKLKYKKFHDNSLLYDLSSYWSELFESASNPAQTISNPTIYLIENTIKTLQLQTQFTLNILQNYFEFDSINQTQETESNSSLSLIEKLGNSLNKKLDSNNLSNNIIELIQKQIKFFYEFIKAQLNQTQISFKNQLSNEEELDENLKKDNNFEFSDKNAQTNENKHSIQIFCFLLEQLSILFTRIKSYDVLNEFLIFFSPSIELLAELNSLSKQTPTQSTQTQSQSHLNSHYRYSGSNQEKFCLNFQSNRRSNDLYDTFSMQIASLIQNHLSKTYSNHQFDSTLLQKLEPIFYSFLFFTTKPNLKQKTLQAWNSTFGKSTVSCLKYSKRLENLFVEIREEMINKSKSSNNSTSLFAISLPGFKPIDLLNQGTNNSTFIQEDEYMNDEKENTPESANKNIEKIDLNSGPLTTIGKDLNESNSVPMVHFVSQQKQTDKIQHQTENSTNLTANFVFSPAGRNSFLNSLNNQTNKSHSASKVNSLKTPENKNSRLRQSPRSLNHNSKRKLDLNSLIDQAPDKDFVEINKPNCNLLKRINTETKNESPGRKSNKSFKQPLTEHQKEVRKQKSFIPMEIQSVCSELEPDSQMSCSMMDEDTNTQSTQMSNTSLNTKQISNETIKAIIQFKSKKSKIEQEGNANDKMEVETVNQKEDASSPVSSQATIIKFQSKINPKKQIELVAVTETVTVQTEPEVSNDSSSQNSEESNSDALIPSESQTQSDLKKEQEDSGQRRRSARLQLKEANTPSKNELINEVSALVDNLESKLNQEKKEEKKKYTRLEILKKRNELIKKSKNLSLLKPKNFKSKNTNLLKKNLKSLKYKKLILNNLKQYNQQENLKSNKKLKKSLKKKFLEKINRELSESAQENKNEPHEQKSETKKEITEQLMAIEQQQDNLMSEDEEDDQPLSNLIKKHQLQKIEENQSDSKKIAEPEPIEADSKELAEPEPIEADSKEPAEPEPIEADSIKQSLNTKSKSLLEPLIEDQVTNTTNCSPLPQNANKLGSAKKTTEDLMHKLNNTPTTSILKKRLSKLINQASESNEVSQNLNQSNSAQNETPNKRRVSFCESVQIEEIEPNFNKSIFNRSTPRLQNKAKIVLSPYFSKATLSSSPQISSTTSLSVSICTATTNLTNQTQDSKTSVSAPNTPLNKHTVSATNNLNNQNQTKINQNIRLTDSPSTSNSNPPVVPNSPSSSSLIDFFSSNKQNFLSQRASIIQQQMQNKSELSNSPLVNKGLSVSLNLATNTTLTESPKFLNKTGVEADFKLNENKDEQLKSISSRLKTNKLSLEALFDQIDTSIYMNKLGSYKYFKYKGILTVGEFCSLSPNDINILPFKAPKIENFLNLVKQFEEKCSDLINKNSNQNLDISLNSTASSSIDKNENQLAKTKMGSVEEEMEKLESTNCLDTSIESESIAEMLNKEKEMENSNLNLTGMDIDTEQNEKYKTENEDDLKKFTKNLELFTTSLSGIKIDANMKDIKNLIDFANEIDQARLKLTESLNNVQFMIRNIISSKINQN